MIVVMIVVKRMEGNMIMMIIPKEWKAHARTQALVHGAYSYSIHIMYI